MLGQTLRWLVSFVHPAPDWPGLTLWWLVSFVHPAPDWLGLTLWWLVSFVYPAPGWIRCFPINNFKARSVFISKLFPNIFFFCQSNIVFIFLLRIEELFNYLKCDNKTNLYDRKKYSNTEEYIASTLHYAVWYWLNCLNLIIISKLNVIRNK